MNQLNSSFLGNKIHSQIFNVFLFYYLSGFSHAESMKLEATTDATYPQREIFQFLFCWILCRPWSNRVLSVSEERRPLSRRNNFRSLSAISLRVVGWSVGRSLRYSPFYLSILSIFRPLLPSFRYPLALQMQRRRIQRKEESKFVVATCDLDVTISQGEEKWRDQLMVNVDPLHWQMDTQ